MASEKRLIDANALKSAIDEYMKSVYGCPLDEVAEFQRSTNDKALIYAVEGLYEATEIIDDTPTVDASEVVHSSWKFNKDGSGTCMHCHRTTKGVWDFDSNMRYCPDCGAKMDLKGE